LVRALTLQRLEVFLGTLDSTSYQPRQVFPTSVTHAGGGFANPPRHSLAAGLYHGSGWPILMRHPITPRERGRSIHLQSIDYAFRPRLRSRLTLRGRPLLRNPWAFGGRDSHPSYRYSFLHSHFRYLHHSSRYGFNGLRNAPLPLTLIECQAAVSVADLAPIIFGAKTLD
jgi:hypothetical protein